MKKTICLTAILLSGLLVYGCPHKTVTVKTDRFKTLFTDGLKHEAQQEWQKAQTAYQTAISAASDNQQTQAAQDRLSNVEKQFRLQALYEKFVDYQNREASDKMREMLSAAYPIAPYNPYTCKMMAALAVKHNVRPGDLISELYQYYYGKTESYELVDKVNAYNKINNPEKIQPVRLLSNVGWATFYHSPG